MSGGSVISENYVIRSGGIIDAWMACNPEIPAKDRFMKKFRDTLLVHILPTVLMILMMALAMSLLNRQLS